MKKWASLLALLILLQTLSAALCLGKARGFGFLLDDAWIHQVYARKLGLNGVMAFSPGQSSIGSTSFGWTVLLTICCVFNVPFFLWTYRWAGLFSIATAFTVAQPGNSLSATRCCLLKWHFRYGI